MKKNTTIAVIFLVVVFQSLSLGQTVSTFIGPGINIDDALILDAEGNIYGSHFTGSAIYKVTPEGDISIYADGFNTPNDLAFDAEGNLYVADNQRNAVFKITPDSNITQFGPTITSASGLIFDRHSDTLLVTQYLSNRIIKLAPDGSTRNYITGFGLDGPVGLAYDDNDTLYVGNYNDGQIFKIVNDRPQRIAIVPGTNFGAIGFLAYIAGDLYATAIGRHRIYKITLDGVMTEFAGTGSPGLEDGPASTARFTNPNGIIASASGNEILISDFGTKSIRVISDIVTGIEPENVSEIPISLRLEQNFPNPFNPSTEIRFSLPEAQNVELAVYDIRGSKIVTLVKSQLAAGVYRMPFNASGLSSGVYIYQLISGEFVDRKKMVLMQ